MFCIIALIILAVIGIFSITCRRLAREALDCVLRRVTLRPCVTGFDERMKARILGSVINRSEMAARILNRNFELFSWVLFLLMLGSSAWGMRGLYLYYVTGSCSGGDAASFCLLDPRGSHHQVSTASGICPLKPPTTADLSLQGVDLGLFPAITAGSRDRVVMIGCYGCKHSRTAYYRLKRLAERYHADFVYLDYPTKVRTDLMNRLGNCVYRHDREKYWRLNELLFTTDPVTLDDASFAGRAASALGIDPDLVARCLQDRATVRLVDRQLGEVIGTGFYGTPTVFINGHPFVGPKPYRVYAIALRGLFYWLPVT